MPMFDNPAMLLTFAILAVTILLFIFSKLRADVVALLSLLALFLSGILSSEQALAGFANSTVIMVAALPPPCCWRPSPFRPRRDSESRRSRW